MTPDMEHRHCIYLSWGVGVGCGCDYGQRRVWGCYWMLLYHTRGDLRWVGGVQYEDQGAMKAEGQARLEPPRNPGYVSTGCCVCAAGSGLHGVRGGGRLHGSGGERTAGGPFLLGRMRAALYLACCVAPIRGALAFCLLLCCCVAMPCPFTPGEQTGQCPSPLLMLRLAVATAPKAWLAGIPGPLGPPSCCGPPEAALGPMGSSKAGTTCRCEMPCTSSLRHDKWS